MDTGNPEPAAAADPAPAAKGSKIVLQPGEGESYWQPKPASGYAVVKISADICDSRNVTMGIQVVAPGGYVREHWHSDNEEILFCFEGRGTIVVDGEPRPFVPGTTAFLGRWVKHKIVNDGRDVLKFTWTYLPPGLDRFFAGIGRPRLAGEPEPEPFERPGDTLAVESRTGFGPPIGD
jgi:quercetin dioxygenase-like cupin family protein